MTGMIDDFRKAVVGQCYSDYLGQPLKVVAVSDFLRSNYCLVCDVLVDGFIRRRIYPAKEWGMSYFQNLSPRQEAELRQKLSALEQSAQTQPKCTENQGQRALDRARDPRTQQEPRINQDDKVVT